MDECSVFSMVVHPFFCISHAIMRPLVWSLQFYLIGDFFGAGGGGEPGGPRLVLQSDRCVECFPSCPGWHLEIDYMELLIVLTILCTISNTYCVSHLLNVYPSFPSAFVRCCFSLSTHDMAGLDEHSAVLQGVRYVRRQLPFRQRAFARDYGGYGPRSGHYPSERGTLIDRTLLPGT